MVLEKTTVETLPAIEPAAVPHYWPLKKASEIAGVSRTTLRKYLRSGDLVGRKGASGRWSVSETALVEFIKWYAGEA